MKIRKPELNIDLPIYKTGRSVYYKVIINKLNVQYLKNERRRSYESSKSDESGKSGKLGERAFGKQDYPWLDDISIGGLLRTYCG